MCGDFPSKLDLYQAEQHDDRMGKQYQEWNRAVIDKLQYLLQVCPVVIHGVQRELLET